MAKCKYCHENISRLDKEICPFCGGKRPLDGTDTTTQDVTKIINQIDGCEKIKHKKRIIAALLSILFGFLGAPLFYLGKNKKGFLKALICIIFIGGVGSFFLAFTTLNPFVCYLIPFCIVELYSLFKAYTYLTNRSIQDSSGEFLE